MVPFLAPQPVITQKSGSPFSALRIKTWGFLTRRRPAPENPSICLLYRLMGRSKWRDDELSWLQSELSSGDIQSKLSARPAPGEKAEGTLKKVAAVLADKFRTLFLKGPRQAETEEAFAARVGTAGRKARKKLARYESETQADFEQRRDGLSSVSPSEFCKRRIADRY